jgi:hypothetical protein
MIKGYTIVRNDSWALQGIEMYAAVQAAMAARRVTLWVTTFELWTVRGPAVQHRLPFADK